MKKYLLAFLLTALVILSGCRDSRKGRDSQTDIFSFDNISASFTAEFGKTEASGDFYFSQEELRLEFKKPEIISSLILCADSDGIGMSYKDVEIKKDLSSVTKTFFVSEIYCVLNNARENGAVEKDGENKLISGENYSLTLDPSGRVTKILIPDKNIKISLFYGE